MNDRMLEPALIRCPRCSALVAMQDAARCGKHETDPLCGFCWRDHIERQDDPLRCWAEVGRLDWS